MREKFEAAMTTDEFTTGELFHMEADKKRKIALLAGLTNDSDQLAEMCASDPKLYADAIQLCVQSINHYENTLELLVGSAARLSAVAEEQNMKYSSSEEVRTLLKRWQDAAKNT